MALVLRIVATVMIVSVVAGLSGMTWDSFSAKGLSWRAINIISALFLWPLFVALSGLVTIGLMGIWGWQP